VPRLAVALASRPLMRRRGRIWRVTSSGRQCPKKECRTWIRRGRSCRDPRPAPDADPGTARHPRMSRRWNGWGRCGRTSRTEASRGCVTRETPTPSHGEHARRKVGMTPSPASLNRKDTKRRAEKVGPGCVRGETKEIPWSVRHARGRCGSSVLSRIHR
jgi:hypothetical protein